MAAAAAATACSHRQQHHLLWLLLATVICAGLSRHSVAAAGTCGVALCFAIDESSSQTAANFASAMQLVKDVVGNISQVSDSSLFGASQFSITGSPIAGLENLSSDVPYVLDKLRANTFGNGTTNTDGGIRQCYE